MTEAIRTALEALTAAKLVMSNAANAMQYRRTVHAQEQVAVALGKIGEAIALNDSAIATLTAEMERPAPEPVAWQPILTAPRGSGKDGPGDTRHPDYVQPPKLLLWTQEGPVVGYYDWYYHPGYGNGAEPGESVWRDHDGGRTYGASHWMPLPAPQAKDQT